MTCLLLLVPHERRDMARRDGGKGGRNHQIVPILKATTVCLTKVLQSQDQAAFSFTFPESTVKLHPARLGLGTMQNVLQRNYYLCTSPETKTHSRTQAKQAFPYMYIYTFVKMFITIRSTSPTFTRTYKTQDKTIQHICAATCLFVLSGDRLKHLGPSASSSCRQTGPWI